MFLDCSLDMEWFVCFYRKTTKLNLVYTTLFMYKYTIQINPNKTCSAFSCFLAINASSLDDQIVPKENTIKKADI